MATDAKNRSVKRNPSGMRVPRRKRSRRACCSGVGAGAAEAGLGMARDEVAEARLLVHRAGLLQQELRALGRETPLRRVRRLEVAAGLTRRAVGVVEAARRAVAAHVAAELGVRHAGAGVLVGRPQVPGGVQVAPAARARRAQRQRAVVGVRLLLDHGLRDDAALGVAPDVGVSRLAVPLAESAPHVVDVAPGVADRPADRAIRRGADRVPERRAESAGSRRHP